MSMNEKRENENVSRRSFLKAATLTAVAATATGAGAALVNKQPAGRPVVPHITSSLPQAAIVPQTNVAASGPGTADTWARLAESQAENVRLQAALAASERQAAALAQQAAGNGSATEQLTVELAEANQQVSLLAGLVALYEQFESVDVEAAVTGGMAAVSETITEWVEGIPTLDEGIELGRQALDDLENHIPLLENGRIWLDSQIDKVQLYYRAIELLLETAVETIGPFLQMINEWFQKVNRWLPFNLGEQAVNVMDSITTLLVETPHTVSGLHTNIAQPLDVWLSRENGETPLQQKVVKPLREGVLDKAKVATAKAQQVQTVYQTQLIEPAQTAVDAQRAFRTQIAQYRELHQI
jgi:hypothetical protein